MFRLDTRASLLAKVIVVLPFVVVLAAKAQFTPNDSVCTHDIEQWGGGGDCKPSGIHCIPWFENDKPCADFVFCVGNGYCEDMPKSFCQEIEPNLTPKIGQERDCAFVDDVCDCYGEDPFETGGNCLQASECE